MNETDKARLVQIIGIVLSTLLAVAAVFGYDVKVIQPREAAGLSASPPVVAERGITNFNDLVVDSVTTTGAVAAGGDLSTSAKLLQASTAVTLTAGMTVTPATNFYVISSSGAVSMTLAAPTGTGQALYLYGDDNYTVTVNDTNIYTSDGNAVTFGQYDLVEFVSVLGKWVLVGKSANS